MQKKIVFIFITSTLAFLLSGCVVKGVIPKGNTLMDDRLSNYCTLDSGVLKDCYAGSYTVTPPDSYADADIHKYHPKVLRVPGLIRQYRNLHTHIYPPEKLNRFRIQN